MWSRLSLVAFFISISSLAMLSLGKFFGIPYWVLFYIGVISFGIAGFIFSLLSNFFDKQKRQVNKVQSLLFYMGMISVFGGLMFKFMHYPYSNLLLIAGIGLSSLSFFVRKFNVDKEKDELLDSDL